MSSSSKWEVTRFEIFTNGIDRTTDRLYANGRMQVPLKIIIQAAVKDEPVEGQHRTYTLSKKELAGIGLKDQHLDAPLPSGWNYTHSKVGEWVDTFPDSRTFAAADDSEMSEMSDDGQVKILWVSTTAIGRKHIAATIPTKVGNVQTAAVTLIAEDPVKYNMNNNNIRHYSEGRDPYLSNQRNWYFSTITYPTKLAEIHSDFYDKWDKASSKFWGCDENLMKSACFFQAPPESMPARLSRTRVYYIWPVISSENPPSQITVDRSQNALCLTSFDGARVGGSWMGLEILSNTWFEIFDIYGNSGRFTIDLTKWPGQPDVSFHNHS